jgi:hypothetical protein
LQVAVLFFNGVIDHILGTMEKINRFFDTWSKGAREVDEALWREAPGRLFCVIRGLGGDHDSVHTLSSPAEMKPLEPNSILK